jgi:ATP synthase protein I
VKNGNDWKYAQTGLQLAAGVLLGFWGGNALDRRLGSGPWLALLGAGLGLAAGFWLFIREMRDGGDFK